MKKTSGQALIEAVVAVGIMALLTTGLLVSTTYALRTGKNGQNRSIAAKYAQEGVELARSLRDKGWTAFSTTYADKTWCLPKDGVWTIGACATNQWVDSIYNRYVAYSWDAANQRMDVTVTVEWHDASGV